MGPSTGSGRAVVRKDQRERPLRAAATTPFGLSPSKPSSQGWLRDGPFDRLRASGCSEKINESAASRCRNNSVRAEPVEALVPGVASGWALRQAQGERLFGRINESARFALPQQLRSG